MAIDLRSDFIARPTTEMVQAMTRAARQTPGFGPREDQNVRTLERLAARMLGKQDALFCPTCMMANQIAIHIHCRPGEAFITEANAHVLTSESAAAAALSGAMPVLVPARHGVLDVEALRETLEDGDAQRARTAMVLLENTHVRSGGTLMNVSQMCAIAEIAHAAGAAVHLDGARLFNAAVALEVDPSALTTMAESVSVNLNKGLGAPLGAIIAGDVPLITEGVRVRQMFGGGWRPAGIPAAAGVVALQHMVSRLSDDHHRTRQLAMALSQMSGLAIDISTVQTNIVLAKPTVLSPGALAQALARYDVLGLPFGAYLRLVIHHEIDDAAIARTIEAFHAVLRGADNES